MICSDLDSDEKLKQALIRLSEDLYKILPGEVGYGDYSREQRTKNDFKYIMRFINEGTNNE